MLKLYIIEIWNSCIRKPNIVEELVRKEDAQSGFEDVTVSCVGCNCCADSTEHDQKVSISIFAAYGVKK